MQDPESKARCFAVLFDPLPIPQEAPASGNPAASSSDNFVCARNPARVSRADRSQSRMLTTWSCSSATAEIRRLGVLRIRLKKLMLAKPR